MEMRLCCVPVLNDTDRDRVKETKKYLCDIKDMIYKCGTADEYARTITYTIDILEMIQNGQPLE